MKRLGVNLNPFIEYLKRLDIQSYNINHLVSLADISSVDAISLYYDESLENLSYEDLAIIKHLSNSFINIKVNARKQSYRKILDLKPDMITLCGELNTLTHEAKTLDSNFDIDQFKHIVDMIKSNNIFCSVLINNEMKDLRNFSKSSIDYIEISLNTLNNSYNIKEENEELEKINLISLASEKLGIGINASNFSIKENLEHIERLELVEELYTDFHFFEECMLHGFQRNMEKYINKIKRL